MSQTSDGVVSITTDDLMSIEGVVPGVLISRLGAGPGVASISRVDLGPAVLVFGRFEFATAGEGALGGTPLRVSVPLGSSVGHWNGVDFADDLVWFYEPGTEYHGAGRAGRDRPTTRWVSIEVPHDAELEPRDCTESPHHGARWWVQRDPGASFRLDLTSLVSDPSLGELDPVRRRRLGRTLVAEVRDLAGGSNVESVAPRSAASVVRRSIAVARDHDPMPTTSELASELGLSDRGIRGAFSSLFGVSVTVFFRMRALYGAHRQLRAATPGSVSVTEVAMHWGFWHLGRFAGHYRAHFGELPSTTLGRVG